MEQTTIPTSTDWLEQEEATLKQTQAKTEFPKTPGLQLAQDDITEFDIDFTAPFKTWYDETNNVTKAMIPVTHAGVQKLWWLNRANPTYPEVIRAGRAGTTHFRILTTGTAKNTKYKLK